MPGVAAGSRLNPPFLLPCLRGRQHWGGSHKSARPVSWGTSAHGSARRELHSPAELSRAHSQAAGPLLPSSSSPWGLAAGKGTALSALWF